MSGSIYLDSRIPVGRIDTLIIRFESRIPFFFSRKRRRGVTICHSNHLQDLPEAIFHAMFKENFVLICKILVL